MEESATSRGPIINRTDYVLLTASENFVAFYENGAKLRVKGVYASDDSNLPMDHDGKSLLQRAPRYSLLFEQVEKPCEADS